MQIDPYVQPGRHRNEPVKVKVVPTSIPQGSAQRSASTDSAGIQTDASVDPCTHTNSGTPSLQPSSAQTSVINSNHSSVLPTTMATQTERDLWGSPMSAGRSFLSPTRGSSQCNCEYNVRLLLEWKREIKKRVEEQEKARSNFLRERLARSEEDREKQCTAMGTMSNQIAANAAMIAELTGNGISAGAYDYGARVFACQTGNTSKSDRPPPEVANPNTQHTQKEARFFPTSKRNGPPSQEAVPAVDIRYKNTVPPTTGPSTARGAQTPQLAPLPQRERGQSDRSSNLRGQGQGSVSKTVSNLIPPSNTMNSVTRPAETIPRSGPTARSSRLS